MKAKPALSLSLIIYETSQKMKAKPALSLSLIIYDTSQLIQAKPASPHLMFICTHLLNWLLSDAISCLFVKKFGRGWTNLERILDRSTTPFLPVQIPVPDKPRDRTSSPG